VGVVVLVLFGSGRISGVMGELGQGMKAFRKGMGDDEAAAKAKVNGPSPEA